VRVGGNAAPLLLLALALAPALLYAVVARPLVAVLLVLAVIPVGAVHLPTPLISLQAIEVAVLGVAALVVLRRLGRGESPLPWANQLWWALALLAWTLIATSTAVDTTLALKQVALLGGGIIFVPVVLAALESMEDVRRMLSALVAVAVGIALAALSQGVNYQATFGAETVSGRLQGAFDHPNQLALFCSMTASIAAGLAFGLRSRIARLLAAAAIAPIMVVLMLTLSRGAWIGAGFAFFFLIFTLREARRAFFLVGVPLIVVAAFVGSFAPGTTETQIVGQRARDLTTLSPYDGRSAIYAEALREIRGHPLVGVGPGDFPVAAERAGSAATSFFPDHAHDLWLTWGAEVGLPAVAIILVLILALGSALRDAGRSAVARGDRRDRAIMAGLGAALVAMLGQGIFDYLLRNAVLWIILWGLLGAILVCAREYRSLLPSAPAGGASPSGSS
jgi:O-antigen ligase